MDDPLPGMCLAISRLTWSSGILFVFAGLLSMFFSYIYFLLNNFSRSRLLQTAENDKDQKRLEAFVEAIPKMLNSVVAVEIIAKTVFVLAVYVFMTSLYGNTATPDFRPLLWTFLAAAFWLVFFCRLLPAELGSWQEEAILHKMLPFLSGLAILLFPVHSVLSPFRKWVDRTLTPSNPEEEAEEITEEIIDAVGEGEREGVIREDEADMIENIVEFRDADAADIMTPRTDMKAVEAETPLKEAVRLAVGEGHSRIPVFKEDPDHVIGILYVKDILNHWVNGNIEAADLKKIARKPYFVPETKKIAELFHEFRENKVHIAIVLDEYGGTAGLVTNEDIIEEIVGEIMDEYDTEEESEVRVVDGSTLDASAIARISDLNKDFGTAIPESEDFETVGGFIFSALGRVPRKGDSLRAGAAKLTVTEVSDRRVKRVRIEIAKKEE